MLARATIVHFAITAPLPHTNIRAPFSLPVKLAIRTRPLGSTLFRRCVDRGFLVLALAFGLLSGGKGGGITSALHVVSPGTLTAYLYLNLFY